jgi:hypothetical protein
VESFPHPILPTVLGRARLSNHPCQQEVSPSKLASHRHSLGRRQLRTLGPHHVGRFLLHHCSSNSRVTNIVGNTKRPRAGTSNNRWNIGPNQRRSPRLGRGCSNLPNMHLHPASIEEANNQRLRASVLGDLELQHGGLCQHLSNRHVGPPL